MIPYELIKNLLPVVLVMVILIDMLHSRLKIKIITIVLLMVGSMFPTMLAIVYIYTKSMKNKKIDKRRRSDDK